ncbi:MAG TPA: hypothetical protein VKJ45_17875 [Blastocatellia bacterium]|nr:hypothetical protein [Blastocatellia bacterium]
MTLLMRRCGIAAPTVAGFRCPGIFCTIRQVRGQSAILGGPDRIGDQHEYLPPRVPDDCDGVDGEILDLRELVLTKERAIEFFSDGPPLASHLRRPRKRGIVV